MKVLLIRKIINFLQNWCVTKGTIPIPGARNIRQAQDNADAMGWRLTDAEMQDLDVASREVDGQMPMMPANP